MNLLKQKIQSKQKIVGTIVSLSDPCICDIIATQPYDYVWIDMEHSHISYKDLLTHLHAAQASKMPAIVRVPQDDLTATKKVLETGIDGIIFPMARTVEDVRRWISYTLYPPHGTRGFGPIRAIRYGADDAIEYVEKSSLEICRFVQIEHIDLINELEEVAKEPFLDGFILGPNDLSGSMGKLGHVFDDDVAEQIKKAISIARKHGKMIGLAGGFDEKTLKYWSQFDLDMITAGSDWNFLYLQAKNTLERLKDIFVNKEL